MQMNKPNKIKKINPNNMYNMQNMHNMYNMHSDPFDDLISKAFGSHFSSDLDIFGGSMFGNRRPMIGGSSNGLMDIFSNRFGGNMDGISVGGQGNNGTLICKSYVTTFKLDKNGRPVKQEYSSSSVNQFTKDGKLSEKRSTFQDPLNGIKKASHQRMINDKGHKIVKTKNYANNESNEDHFYNGMNEGKFEFLYLIY